MGVTKKPTLKALRSKQTKSERLRLRNALERLSVELQDKNRELQIEAGLERVRTVAMGMRQPGDMLEICSTISHELESLKVKDIRNVQTAIFYPQRGTYMNYEYYVKHKRTFTTETIYSNNKIHNAFAVKMLKGEGEFFTTHIKGKKVKDWLSYQKTTNVFIDKYLRTASSLSYYWYSLGPVAMGISSYSPLTDNDLSLFKRFRNVFELAYRRYLDIEQALAQATEAKIESSLEKVRAQAMSMRTTQELKGVGEIIFTELKSLGFSGLRNTEILINNDLKKSVISHYYSDYGVSGTIEVFYNDHPVVKKWANDMKKASDAFAEVVISEKEIRAWRRYREEIGYLPDPKLDAAKSVYYYSYSTGLGTLSVSSFKPITEAQLTILKRFRNVFGLAYRRYVDVARAEVHARESEIELSLERVRARSMAMHKSDELVEAADVVFQQLTELGIESIRTGIATFDAVKETVTVWSRAHADSARKILGVVPRKSHPFFVGCFDAWKAKKKFYSQEFVGKEVAEYYRRMSSILSYPATKIHYPKEVFYTFFFPEGSVNVITQEKLADDELSLMERFASVFGLMYRRFLDLQKAEEQAREAQIEAALERIRASAMAMHTSNDLENVVHTLREQMGLLGQPELETSVISLFEEDSDRLFSWYAFRSPELSSGKIITGTTSFRSTASALTREMMTAYRSGNKEHTIEADGAKASELERVLTESDPKIALHIEEDVPDRLWYHLTFFSGGTFLMVAHHPPSDEAKSLQGRAASVFDLAYRRYRDLRKAEAQAREAQIEAAMEKVRGRAMAMHSSNDLAETTATIFKELQKLGIASVRCGVVLLSKSSRRTLLYATSTSLESDSLALIGSFEMKGHPSFEEQYQAWLKQEDYYTTVGGEQLRSRYELLRASISVPYLPNGHGEHAEHGYFFTFSEGQFYAWTQERYSVEEISILSRFKTIVELTFRRYLDLQKAEAQAREAQIEASLERVRSRTLAMQKSDELAGTAAVLFKQLIALGIEPNRLYIAVLQDDSGNVEFWIMDEDGSKVSSGFRANLLGNRSWKKMFEGWRDGKKSVTIDMQGEELEDYFRHLNSLNVPFKGGLSQKRRVQSVAYFSKGFIGMASPHEQPEETATLLERFAAAFNLTFTRFNDLKLAEAQAHQAHLDLIQLHAEKKRAEDALSELSATQAQLVQQEKLASLGQLTAGIAHEIKNPLNFVNNFSSVSVELVDEVMEEINRTVPDLHRGDIPHLLRDIKANLGKIIEHGTRADGIVKSMLQHSRGGSRRREPTDLNALIKEYVNLAFHGMRASKNPINVDIRLDLDPSAGSMSLIAEDFSRVILNLCQNAFDAMREKVNPGEQKQQPYQPRLAVRTYREASKVTITVEDNGPGIPDALKDKVLQPFFTTKKGTQGTGLGLSISNDIVKAHGGEMKVDTNGDGGATFTIALSVEPQA